MKCDFAKVSHCESSWFYNIKSCNRCDLPILLSWFLSTSNWWIRSFNLLTSLSFFFRSCLNCTSLCFKIPSSFLICQNKWHQYLKYVINKLINFIYKYSFNSESYWVGCSNTKFLTTYLLLFSIHIIEHQLSYIMKYNPAKKVHAPKNHCVFCHLDRASKIIRAWQIG